MAKFAVEVSFEYKYFSKYKYPFQGQYLTPTVGVILLSALVIQCNLDDPSSTLPKGQRIYLLRAMPRYLREALAVDCTLNQVLSSGFSAQAN